MRIQQIQGIRALAISGIFISHTKVWLNYSPEAYPNLDLSLAMLGPGGVYTFFIISGFLLSFKNTFIKRVKIVDSVRLGWKKIEMLYPLHVVMLIIAFIGKYPETTKEWVWSLIDLPFNITLTQDLIPMVGVVNSYNGPSWFLSAFFLVWVFTYLCPYFVNKIQKLSIRGCLFAVAFLLISQLAYLYLFLIFPYYLIPFNKEAYSGWFTYYSPVVCYSEFLLGICLGRFSFLYKPQALLMYVLQLIALISAYYCICVVPNSCFIILFQSIIEVVIMLGILSVLSDSKAGGGILSSRLLVWMGDISAFIFLIHGAYAFLVKKYFQSQIENPWPFILVLGATLISSAIVDKTQIVKR